MTTPLQPGSLCHFGRRHGEKTLGRVLHVNPKSVKVEQLEARGALRAYPVGTEWRVAPHLVTPLGASVPEATPSVPPARSEPEIMKDILGCYCRLSPEALTCDGELPQAQVARKAAALRAQLRALFTELGRHVTESEAYGYAH